jgi:hypothetical protein
MATTSSSNCCCGTEIKPSAKKKKKRKSNTVVDAIMIRMLAREHTHLLQSALPALACEVAAVCGISSSSASPSECA